MIDVQGKESPKEEPFRPHGIVIRVRENGEIFEMTYRHGRKHGLSRNIYGANVDYTFYRDDQAIASKTFKLRTETKQGKDGKDFEEV